MNGQSSPSLGSLYFLKSFTNYHLCWFWNNVFHHVFDMSCTIIWNCVIEPKKPCISISMQICDYEDNLVSRDTPSRGVNIIVIPGSILLSDISYELIAPVTILQFHCRSQAFWTTDYTIHRSRRFAMSSHLPKDEYMRSQVLMVVKMLIIIFWGVSPCSLLETSRIWISCCLS